MKYQCDNCDFETENEETFPTLSEVHHLGERLDAGGVVPHGECPECGAFVYDNEEATPSITLDVNDGSELFHAFKNRGSSETKRKVAKFLRELDEHHGRTTPAEYWYVES